MKKGRRRRHTRRRQSHEGIGGVARTNSVTDVKTGDCHLFETMSRANHSCDPNLAVRLVREAGAWGLPWRVCLFAKRDIEAGEELTWSYTNGRAGRSKSTKCYCGSQKCRGTL